MHSTYPPAFSLNVACPMASIRFPPVALWEPGRRQRGQGGHITTLVLGGLNSRISICPLTNRSPEIGIAAQYGRAIVTWV